MQLDKLACSECGAFLHADDIDTARGMATCRGCRAVLPLSKLLSSQPGRTDLPLVQEQAVEKPGTIEVAKEHGRLCLRLRRSRGPFLLAVLFLVLITVSPVLGLIVEGKPLSGLVGPAGVVLVLLEAVWLYIAGVLLVNRTRIEIGEQSLQISDAPLPWPGGKTLEARSIVQVYVRAKGLTTKQGPSFDVYAIRRDETKERLVRSVQYLQEAQYLEQCIEEALGISDRAVSDEYAPSET